MTAFTLQTDPKSQKSFVTRWEANYLGAFGGYVYAGRIPFDTPEKALAYMKRKEGENGGKK